MYVGVMREWYKATDMRIDDKRYSPDYFYENDSNALLSLDRDHGFGKLRYMKGEVGYVRTLADILYLGSHNLRCGMLKRPLGKSLPQRPL
jgi:hypothetical protein